MATIDNVADDELIATAWGNAVADEVNNNVVKLTGGTMSGYLNSPGFFLTEGQTAHAHGATRKDYVDQRDLETGARMTSVQVNGNNIPAGLIGLNGTLSLPAPLSHTFYWAIFWNYLLSGHSAGTEYRTRMINASTGSPLSINGFSHYDAGESHIGQHASFFAIGAGTAFLMGFQMEIANIGANTNVAGQCFAIGTPAF